MFPHEIQSDRSDWISCLNVPCIRHRASRTSMAREGKTNSAGNRREVALRRKQRRSNRVLLMCFLFTHSPPWFVLVDWVRRVFNPRPRQGNRFYRGKRLPHRVHPLFQRVCIPRHPSIRLPTPRAAQRLRFAFVMLIGISRG